MRYILILILLINTAYGQGVTTFGASRAQDTSKTFGQVRFNAYTGADTTVPVFMPNGTIKQVSKGYFSSGGSFIPYSDTATKVATRWGQRGTNYVGNIYKANSWSNLDTFTNNGVTASIVSNKIEFTAGGNDLVHTLDFDTTTYRSKFRQVAIFKVGSKSSTSYGFGLGFRSNNATTNGNVSCKFDMTTSGSSGKLFLLLPTAFDSSAALSFSINDYIMLDVEFNDDDIICSARNITTNSSWVSVALNYCANINAKHYRAGKFCINSFGGTFTLDSLSISSNEIVNSDLYIISDSKGDWLPSDDFNGYYGSWSSKLQKSITNTTVKAAGGMRASDIVELLPEIKKDAPKQVIILDIGRNDLFSGTSLSSVQAMYRRIVDSLQNWGVQVYHALPPYETAFDLTAFKNWIASTYSPDSVIDTWSPTFSCGSACLNVDGVHPNDSGNIVIYNAIMEFSKIEKATNLIDRVLTIDDSDIYVNYNKLDSVAALAIAVPTLQQVTDAGATTTNTTTVGALVTDTVRNTGSAANLQLTSTDNATKGNILIGASNALLETNNTLMLGATAYPSGISSGVTQRFNTFSNSTNLHIYGSFTSGAVGNAINFYRANGTMSSPTASTDGDNSFALQSIHYNGTTYATGGTLTFTASGTWSGSNRGTTMTITTAENGSTSRRNRIEILSTGTIALNSSAGNVLAGTNTDNGSGRRLQVTGRIGATDTIYTATRMQEAGITNAIIGTDANGVHYAASLSASATLDFPNTSNGDESDLTITVTGAADGDVVALGTPAGSSADGSFHAYVSSANTVTVRFVNHKGTSIDPPSGTFKVIVFK